MIRFSSILFRHGTGKSEQKENNLTDEERISDPAMEKNVVAMRMTHARDSNKKNDAMNHHENTMFESSRNLHYTRPNGITGQEQPLQRFGSNRGIWGKKFDEINDRSSSALYRFGNNSQSRNNDLMEARKFPNMTESNHELLSYQYGNNSGVYST